MTEARRYEVNDILVNDMSWKKKVLECKEGKYLLTRRNSNETGVWWTEEEIEGAGYKKQ